MPALNYTREDFINIIETLIDKDCPLYCHPEFRKGMERDQNLFINQVIREANGNVAFRSVDFDLEGMDDETFWERIDDSRFSDFIEESAATAILKMTERIDLA
ncbi:MAG: hypothetical protein HY696_05345 [Deltaproteobacteria bacterium]|nr:hypothetical protein [Deltaproteobacteria bacterium]